MPSHSNGISHSHSEADSRRKKLIHSFGLIALHVAPLSFIKLCLALLSYSEWRLGTYSYSMSDHGPLSKQAELEAIKTVGQKMINVAKVHDLSDSPDFDFEIEYFDGRRAIGEVGLLANRHYESAWATMMSRERQHFIELPNNSGTWGTRLHGIPNIKRFESAVPKIVETLNQNGISNFEVGMHPALRDLSKQCEELGIQYLLKQESVPGNQVVYFLDMGEPIFIDSTLDSLIRSVESSYLEGDHQDSWKKLEKFNADEKHIVFKCGSLIPLNHQHQLLRTAPTPKIPEISFPTGITHIWLLPRFVEAHGILWTRGGQKELFERPK